MRQSNDVINKELHDLVTRLKAKSSLADIESLAIRLNEQFRIDIGVFSAFLLNYIRLHPGEAIFLSADEPHAYISGKKSTRSI